jgi:hypothetical protein
MSTPPSDAFEDRPGDGAPQRDRPRAAFTGKVATLSGDGTYCVLALDATVLGRRRADVTAETSGRVMLLQTPVPKGRLQVGMEVEGTAELRGRRLLAIRIGPRSRP